MKEKTLSAGNAPIAISDIQILKYAKRLDFAYSRSW